MNNIFSHLHEVTYCLTVKGKKSMHITRKIRKLILLGSYFIQKKIDQFFFAFVYNSILKNAVFGLNLAQLTKVNSNLFLEGILCYFD